MYFSTIYCNIESDQTAPLGEFILVASEMKVVWRGVCLNICSRLNQESDCRSSGHEFNHGPVPYFRGD